MAWDGYYIQTHPHYGAGPVVIHGTDRFPVARLLSELACGKSLQEISDEFSVPVRSLRGALLEIRDMPYLKKALRED